MPPLHRLRGAANPAGVAPPDGAKVAAGSPEACLHGVLVNGPSPIRAADPVLFPSFVAQHSIVFDPTGAVDLAQLFPGIALPEPIARSVRKRQMEYCAGRYCAREALRTAGCKEADATILSGAKGEPCWPPGMVGAITHSRGFASAAVAHASDARALGLDAEPVLTDDVADLILTQIASREEVAALVRATQWSTASVLTVVFSAKETVYKCFFPEVRRYFDFRDAVVVALDTQENSFEVRLLVTLTPRLPEGTLLAGRFTRRDDRVCTAMVITC